MRRGFAFGAVLLITLSGAGPLAAQTPAPEPVPALSTDRPGFNAPATVVGAGVVQLELGWALHRDRDGSSASDGPEPLLRVGLGHRLELQVASAGFEAGCAIDCRWLPGDMAIGTRWALPGQPFGASLAVTGSLALPTGHGDVTSHHVEPSAVLHLDRDLGAGVGVSYNLVATRTYDVGPGAAYRVGHGLSFSRGVGPWSPYVAIARRATRVDDGVPWLMQLGTAYLITDDLQVDVTIDRGLTGVEPRWGVAAGLAIRRRPR